MEEEMQEGQEARVGGRQQEEEEGGGEGTGENHRIRWRRNYFRKDDT